MSTKNHEIFLQFRRNFWLYVWGGIVFTGSGASLPFWLLPRCFRGCADKIKAVPGIALRHGDFIFSSCSALRGHYGTRENQMNFFLLTTRMTAVTEARASRTTTLSMEMSAVPGTPVP